MREKSFIKIYSGLESSVRMEADILSIDLVKEIVPGTFLNPLNA